MRLFKAPQHVCWGATVANVTEFNRDYENGRLEYEGEIHYNGYEYDFEIDADTGTITKWEVEQEILNRFDSQFFVFLC